MDMLKDYSYLIPTPYHLVDRRAHRSWRVHPGKRSFHNILLIVEGSGTAWTNGVATPLAPGMLVYHPENEEFGYETSKEHYLHVIGGNFGLSTLINNGKNDPEAQRVQALPIETYTYPGNYDRLVRLFTDLALAWGNGKEHEMLVCRNLFMQILHELVQTCSTYSAEDMKNIKRIEHVIHFMESHYHHKITLHKLAGLTGLTPSYFGQAFRRITGKTPLEYLNNIRVDQALLWMEQGFSISESAAKAGFNEPFYFSRVFKKIKGTSPSDYLKSRGYL